MSVKQSNKAGNSPAKAAQNSWVQMVIWNGQNFTNQLSDLT